MKHYCAMYVGIETNIHCTIMFHGRNIIVQCMFMAETLCNVCSWQKHCAMYVGIKTNIHSTIMFHGRNIIVQCMLVLKPTYIAQCFMAETFCNVCWY